MFRHKGKARTYKYNIKLAALLSFNAGLVNITGLLLLGVLTTNVTGHFAFLAEAFEAGNLTTAFHFLLYIFSFLLGAFFSSLLIELSIRRKFNSTFFASLLSEILILLLIGLFATPLLKQGISPVLLACLMLFSMGIQNSLVTQISSSVVRTTHLTGLFTDLGIELAQLLFYRNHEKLSLLKRSVRLRWTIILFFFLGGTVGGFLFSLMSTYTLVLAAVLLIQPIAYDALRMRYYQFKRKRKQKAQALS